MTYLQASIYPVNYLVGAKRFNIHMSSDQIVDFNLKSLKYLAFGTPDILTLYPFPSWYLRTA